MTEPASFSDIIDEYEFLDKDDRYRLLIDLDKALEPMPEALKT
ncbi:MAG: SufE family protein, partial [Sphingomonadales bacterium]